MRNTKTDEAKLLKLLKKQQKNNKPITKEWLEATKNKKYDSGRKFKVGDTPCYALLKKENERYDVYFQLCSLHIDEMGKKYHFDKYDEIPTKKMVEDYFFKFIIVENEK